VRLQLLELLEGAVDIERVELAHRHAVGDQRHLEGIDGMLADGALTGEVLRIPERCPALRYLARVRLVTPANGNRVDDLRRAVLRAAERRRDVGQCLHGLGIELLEAPFLFQQRAAVGALGREVPGRLSGGDLRAHVGDTGSVVLLDDDVELLLDDAEPRFLLGFLEGAAPRRDGQRLLFLRRRLRHCEQQRRTYE
jgi:hypothetical protein